MAQAFDPTGASNTKRLDPKAVGGTTVQSAATSKGLANHYLMNFSAQETRVEIVPKFSLPAVEGISGTWGPFSTNYPTIVPLWLAMYLRATNTCVLTPPPFVDIGFLENVLQAELEDEVGYQPLHYHFYESVRQLLQHAKDDIPSSGEVQRLVAAIRARRERKLRSAAGMLKGEWFAQTSVKVTNLVAQEIELLRVTLCHVLDDAARFDRLSAPMAAVQLAPTASASVPSGSQQVTSLTTTVTGATPASTSRPSAGTTDVTGDTGTTGASPEAGEAAPTLPEKRKRRTLRQR